MYGTISAGPTTQPKRILSGAAASARGAAKLVTAIPNAASAATTSLRTDTGKTLPVPIDLNVQPRQSIRPLRGRLGHNQPSLGAYRKPRARDAASEGAGAGKEGID